MARQPETRNYFAAAFQMDGGVVLRRTKTQPYLDRLVADYLTAHPQAKGWKSIQTWRLDDQDGPVELVKEEYLDGINGGEVPRMGPPPPGPSKRPRNQRAEW